MQRIKPINNQIYHVYNRGVERRKIFMDELDYFRFVHDLFEFNNKDSAPNINYYFKRQAPSSEVGLPKMEKRPRKLLVDILSFCLMPNHFHLMLKQKSENGITEFMRKLGTGYTNYFNQKYERVGPLFQGKYKSIVIKNENHFVHLPYYIHLNPIELIEPKWKEKKIENYEKATKFLDNYRWSSYLDYTGKKNFPSVIKKDFLNQIFVSPEQHKKDISEWLKEMDFDKIDLIALE